MKGGVTPQDNKHYHSYSQQCCLDCAYCLFGAFLKIMKKGANFESKCLAHSGHIVLSHDLEIGCLQWFKMTYVLSL